MKKNFGKGGFTNFGLSNYGYLRRKRFSREKAIGKLIREDKARKDAVTFVHRMKK